WRFQGVLRPEKHQDEGLYPRFYERMCEPKTTKQVLVQKHA
ncbi:unnamed protein product, partial [marine sediment metagenome]